MKNKALLVTLLLGILAADGCGPVNSLFALYTSEDKFFDENLIGEWQQTPATATESEKNGRWVFLRDGDTSVYKTSLVTIGKRGGFVAKGRLVRLGKAVFVDFEPDTGSSGDSELTLPYPVIESHMIGRIWIEKDQVRLHFLSEDWVKKQLKEGKLTLPHAGPAETPILNATTADLRKFAQEHAEDEEAFSENYELVRMK
jgi:hypothetical protein